MKLREFGSVEKCPETCVKITILSVQHTFLTILRHGYLNKYQYGHFSLDPISLIKLNEILLENLFHRETVGSFRS